MKRPTIFFLLFYLLGVWIYSQLDISVIALSLISIPIYFLFIFTKYIENKRKAFYFLISLFLGFFLAYVQDNALLKEEEIERNIKGNFIVTYKKSTEFNNIYYIKEKRSRFKFLLKSKEEFDLGRELYVEGKIRRIKGQDNFLLFNYRKYLASEGVFNELKADDIDALEKRQTLLTYKEKASSFIEERLSIIEDEKASSLLINIILGKNIMEEEDLNVYRNLGLAHVLAVSGLHINILIFILDIIGLYLEVNKKYYIFFIFFLVFIYGYIISFPISLQRALISYIISQLAIYKEKISDPINGWAFSFLLIVILNPFAIYSPSLWLSFAASFSLIFTYPRMKRIFISSSKYFDSFLLLLSVQISLFPLQIYYFNEINIMSFLANIILVPLIEILIVMAFILAFGLPFVSEILSFLINYLYSVIDWILQLLYQFDIFVFRYRSLSLQEIILYFFILLTCLNYKKLMRRYKKNFIKIAYKYYGVFIVLLFTIKFFGKSPVEIEFIDVGQGEAIRISNGINNVFFDLGGNPLNIEKSGEEFYTYLLKRGIKKIDAIFISHDDLDHMGNYHYIKNKLVIKNVFVSANKGENLDGPIKEVRQGQVYKFKNFSLQVILDGEGSDSSNDSSMVVLLESYGKSLLMTGDIEKEEKKIVENLDSIDILNVSHHGSKHSTKKDFLDSLTIRDAIISVGQYNRYGHPHAQVINNLKDRKINIYRTDLDGAIKVIVDRRGYKIKTYNKS